MHVIRISLTATFENITDNNLVLDVECKPAPPCTTPGVVIATNDKIEESVVFLPFKADAVSF